MNWKLRWMDYDQEVYEEYFYTKEEALEFVDEFTQFAILHVITKLKCDEQDKVTCIAGVSITTSFLKRKWDSMTEKLKYKVGDKVLVEAEIIEADSIPNRIYPYRINCDLGDNSFKQWVTLNWLDENTTYTQPKPKVTQAVMDWYENHKRSHWNVRDYFVHTPEEIDEWLSKALQNEHAFVTLITYGPEAVEVEKEKKYIVEIPDPNSDWIHTVLEKISNISVRIGRTNEDPCGNKRYALTESEIKRNHQWAWDAGFAKPVEEVE